MSPALIVTIITAALQAGAQAVPFLAALLHHRNNAAGDTPASDLIALDHAIELLTRHIEGRP